MSQKGCGGQISTYYPSICLEELRKTMKKLSHDSQSPDSELNLGHPEYKAGVLTTMFSHCCYICSHGKRTSC
jgi:hypothetical protein